ncbi:hypothetical protein [Salmonella phage vB_SenS_SB10]|uniref:Uncharacterized protein n=1 Tax=Salmonella phage vB_SenS_SB10 TaxID=2591134 RepID=A0A5J6TB55_9CAUD|nr:hypothetical protein [Salmonella phage vB_SenS_SB10]
MCNLMKFGKKVISAKIRRNTCLLACLPILTYEISSATPEIHPTTPAQTPHVSPQTSAPFPKAPAIFPQHIHDAC